VAALFLGHIVMDTRKYRPQQFWCTWKTKLKPRPEADEYPDTPADIRDLILADMKQYGFDPHFPIVLAKDGRIAAGRCRYACAQEAKIDFLTTTLPATEDIAKFCEREQDNRKHLTKEWLEKRRKERITRVVEARQEGQSTRAIAAKEHVSQTQVIADLKQATEQGCSVEPESGVIVGKDNKERSSRQPLCEACRTKARKGQALPSKCPDCTAVKKSAERAKNKGENTDADIPPENELPPEAIVDNVGHQIPDACKPSFEILVKFEEVDKHCRSLQKLIDEIVKLPGGEQLARFVKATGSEDKVIHKNEHLNALKRDLKFTRPYSICPKCKGRRGECKGCDGRGWVSKTTWDDFEDAVKQRLA
jgi:hypothetical protein